jgi:hypothetical protein
MRLDRHCCCVVFVLCVQAGLCLAADSAQAQRPVFIHAVCEGAGSSAVLDSFTSAVRSSSMFYVLRHLNDDRGVHPISTVYMNCAEGTTDIAVAPTYGVGKCLKGQCSVSIDGASTRAALCGAASTRACGEALFKAFQEYVVRRR